MAGKTIAQKLLLKPDQRIVLINPPPGYFELLMPLPDDSLLVENPDGPVEFVQLFVKNKQELEHHEQQALKLCQPNSLFWISYPKQSSGIETDIHRDIIWKLMEATGWRPVAMVSIDDTWSAMRLRPSELVGK
jgi:hypothetical protein